MPPRRVISLLGLLMLGGCGIFESAPPPAVPPPQPPAPEPAATVAPPPRPVPLPRARQKPPIDPATLVGMSQDQARNLLGEPGATRSEPPAIVWNYVSAECDFDLRFYLDLASETYTALAYEAVPKGPHGLTGGACLASVRK